MRKGMTFNDVVIVPRYSILPSRESVNIETYIGIHLDTPVISAPMDTVTGADMAVFMAEKGGLGVIHRYQTIEEQVAEVHSFQDRGPTSGTNVGAAVGINGDALLRTHKLIEAGANPIVFDVAHGHTIHCLRRVEMLKGMYPDTIFVSANIATSAAGTDLVNAGADCLRVGIGSGSACTTRVVTGVGVPQLTAVMDVAEAVNAPIIADGGIKTSGDMVKALAAGADAVMLGGLLANFTMAAKPGVFRGMASEEALIDHKGTDEHIPEGKAFNLEVDFDCECEMNQLINGIKLGLSYVGAKDLDELRAYSEFMEVTTNGYIEGTPHYGGAL